MDWIEYKRAFYTTVAHQLCSAVAPVGKLCLNLPQPRLNVTEFHIFTFFFLPTRGRARGERGTRETDVGLRPRPCVPNLVRRVSQSQQETRTLLNSRKLVCPFHVYRPGVRCSCDLNPPEKGPTPSADFTHACFVVVMLWLLTLILSVGCMCGWNEGRGMRIENTRANVRVE